MHSKDFIYGNFTEDNFVVCYNLEDDVITAKIMPYIPRRLISPHEACGDVKKCGNAYRDDFISFANTISGIFKKFDYIFDDETFKHDYIHLIDCMKFNDEYFPNIDAILTHPIFWRLSYTSAAFLARAFEFYRDNPTEILQEQLVCSNENISTVEQMFKSVDLEFSTSHFKILEAFHKNVKNIHIYSCIYIFIYIYIYIYNFFNFRCCAL